MATEVDPTTGSSVREQEFAVEDRHGSEQIGYRDNSPVPPGEESLGFLGDVTTLDLATAEDHQDDTPVRYVDEQDVAQTSEQGFIVGADITPAGPMARPSFDTPAHEAVPTNERAGDSHDSRNISVGVNAFQLVGRRPGRKYILLSCPTTFTSAAGAATPLGFQFSDDPNQLNVGLGFQVNPGDVIPVDSEAAVWVAALPGNVTGLVQFSEVYSTPGGGDGY